MNTEFWAIGLTFSAALIGSFGALFFKFAADNFVFDFLKILKNKFLYLAVFYYIFATILFIPSLKGGELSVLYPIISTSYIWVVFLSMLFLKEKINFLKLSGVIVILIGVSFLGLGS